MNVTGFLWTLYPLIGFLGFIEFLSGLAYLFFCLPFFAFLLPICAGVIACIASVYALMIQYSNRSELTLQFMSALLSFCLFVTTCTETACLRRIYNSNGTGSVCSGILNRTLGSQLACKEMLGSFQSDVVAKLNVEDVHSIEIGLTTVLAVCSLLHCCAGIALTLFSAFETRFQLSPPHWQVVVGLATLLISYAYHSYCCVFFFAYFPTVVACFCLAQAAVPWHFREKSVPRQVFSVVGAGLSMALIAVTTFGIYCWANRHTPADEKAPGVYRFCTLPPKIYQVCHRSLEFSKPYIWWQPEQVLQETAIVQIVTYVLLVLTGSIHFGFFLNDAFG